VVGREAPHHAAADDEEIAGLHAYPAASAGRSSSA
jgi:hypothetical protein